MPIESAELLDKLIARIPELEWKVRGTGSFISSPKLPRGLFRFTEISGASCIAEIKADLHTLSQQNNERSAVYLAERIRQKINVLVVLCQTYYRKNKLEEKKSFGVNMLSTRQQWIRDLETEIHNLTEQQKAMTNTLAQMKFPHNSNSALHLKADLGEVERCLTLAKEALSRAIA